MPLEMPSKPQTLLWWITSIAVSVLCCSILFVLFASYLVEMKDSLKESDARITSIEQREDQILSEIQILRKHQTVQAAQPEAAPSAAPAAETAPAATAPAPAAPATPAPAATPESK